MPKIESDNQIQDPKFDHLDYLCPFEGSDRSEARIGDNWVRVDSDGRVLAVLGAFTSAPYVTPRPGGDSNDV